MSWITIDEARANLKMWLDAERAVASGQSYKIGTRSLTRASLSDIASHQILAQRDRQARKRP